MTRRSGTAFVRLGALTTAVALAFAAAVAVRAQEPRSPRNLAEFEAMFQEINNWGRWGDDD